jgi:hypothetical protein
MRGIGSIRVRPKHGFDGWVCEDRLAVGGSAFALALPRQASTIDGAKLRLIRKAGYFDGMLNGRIEVLVSVEGAPSGRIDVLKAVSFVLSTTVRVPIVGHKSRLSGMAKAVAEVWAQATVPHGDDTKVEMVHAARPIAVAESISLPPVPADVANPADAAIEIVIPDGPAPIETYLIGPTFSGCSTALPDEKRFRHAARYLRTYCLRLQQDIESLSLLLRDEDIDLGSDQLQLMINEYTRRINRSRLNLEHVQGRAIIDWSYSAFSRIYPGQLDALRTRIVKRNLRPNVARKLLAMLEATEKSTITVYGDYRQETTMGDKFENIHGSTIINRSYVTNAMNSVEASHGKEVSDALREIADYIEKKDNEAAAILMNNFAEEAAKEAPDKSRLSQLWDGIVGVLPDIATMAGTVATITKLFV